MPDKRVIEQPISNDVFGDDWFLKDSPQRGTTRISKSDFLRVMSEGFEGIVELTQAEYDALPSTKYNDGILYAIKDSEDIISILNGNICNVTWTTTGTYTEGDYVLHDMALYTCAVATATTGTWVDAEWTRTSMVEMVLDELDDIPDRLDAIEDMEPAWTMKATLPNLPKPIATIPDGANAPIDSLKASIVGVQSGSGEPSPQNVRPISGWTGCEVNKTGKNLYKTTKNGRTNNGVTYVTSGSSITASDSATGTSYAFNNNEWNFNNSLLFKAGTYTISMNQITGSAFAIVKVSENGGADSYIVSYTSDSSATFTLTEDTHIAVNLRITNGSSTDTTFNIQIERGEESSTFEAYNGNTYTIPFKDSSDNPITVYDGENDITGGRWLSNRLFEVFDNTATVTFGRDGQPNWYYQIAGTNTGTSGETAETISNMFSYANIGNDNDNLGIMKLSNGNLRVRVGGTQPATVDDFVNSLGVTPLQVVSKLATPQTGTFAPIALRSNGVTNISVNCGEVTELKYIRDATTTINDILARLDALEG